MYSRFDTIYKRDGQSSRHGIDRAMHSVAQQKSDNAVYEDDSD